MSAITISRVRTRTLIAAMPRPWVPLMPWSHVMVVDIEASDGSVGVGFSWTPTIGATAVRALIDNDIADFVCGLPADPAVVWPALWLHLHEVGGGGLTTIAMAGIDIALWDLVGRSSEVSVATLIGRRRDTVSVYGSGVNLHYDIDELVSQVRRWVGRGYTSVKVKVGKPDLREDIDRLAAVRDALGTDPKLMIDANQRWDLPAARTAIEVLAQFDLLWVEEPLRSDDTAGYRALHVDCPVPIAMGENMYTKYQFRDVMDARAADILQPNIVRVGGITPFLEIAQLVTENGLQIAPHLLIDISGQLALTLEQEVAIEDVEDADFTSLRLLTSPSPVKWDGDRARVSEAHGTGLQFVSAVPSS